MLSLFVRVVAGLLLGLGLNAVQGQIYPSKAVKLVVPFPPGGGTDVTARLFAERLTGKLGQTVIVENLTGAGGMLGTAAVAHATPDGYTLLVGQTGPNTIAPNLRVSPGFDAENDFAPISTLIRMPLFLVVPANSPYKTLKDLVAAGRMDQTLNYASAGPGTLGHLTAELFNAVAGTKFAIVQYRGSAPALMGLYSRDAAFHFASGVDALPQMNGGRLRALAVVGEHRTPLASDVPTAAEAGVSGLTANLWYGLLAPRKTPQAIIERLHREVVAILAEPEMKAKLRTLASEASPSTPQEMGAMIRNDIARYAKLVKMAGIKIQ